MEDESLHMLGTGGYHPTDQRHTACYMLAESGIVLDAGTGFFRVRDLLRTAHLDVLLSHSHLDHCQGLTYLLDVLWQKNVNRVRIHGRPYDLWVVERCLFDSPLFPMGCAYELCPLQPDFEIGGWQVHWREQVHPGGSVGYRLQKQEYIFGYITDTTTADAEDRQAVAFIEGADLLLHECYFDDAHRELSIKSGHSTASEVGKLARNAQVKRLLLVHANPIAEPAETDRMLQRVREFHSDTDIATDGMVINLNAKE